MIPKTLLSLFNDYFSLQTKSIYDKADWKPWITPGILTSICAKKRLEKKASSNPDRFLPIYRRHKNLFTKDTLATNEQYYCTLLDFGNSKKMWSNINFILVKNIVHAIPPLNSMAFTLLSLKQLQMHSIPILIVFF